jgi:methyl-accepting chemotaxis protein
LIAVVIIILSVAIALIISKKITKPIDALIDVAANIANGNLNVNIKTTAGDETGMLARSFVSVVESLNSLLFDIENMYKTHEDGIMANRIDIEKYKGSYRNVAIGVNEMVSSYIVMFDDVFSVLAAIAKGDFSKELKQYKGEKAVVNREVERLMKSVKNVVGLINTFNTEAKKGNLSNRVDVTMYEGAWKEIVLGLNTVMETIFTPMCL